MSPRALLMAPVLAGLIAAAAPALADQTKSVTATGSAEVKVKPANRHSNASIASAVKVAEKAAVPAALNAAHAQALIYAGDAGLTLGSILAVSDATNGPGIGPFFPAYGPFGEGRYCGTVRRAVVKRVNGKLKVVRTRRQHRCFVPPFAGVTLTVTYSAG